MLKLQNLYTIKIPFQKVLNMLKIANINTTRPSESGKISFRGLHEKNMDYNQIKSFVTVAHHGNLTQAAESLHLSQPAVSAQIKAVEKHLNVVLFQRTSGGMALTRAGEAFLPEAEQLLQHHHRLARFAQSLSEHYVEHAEIGLVHPILSSRVTTLTRCIQHHNPDLQLHIQYGMSGEILERVQNKTLQGGFYLGAANHRGIRSLFLEDIRYCLICPAKAAAHIQADDPTDLENYTWIEMSGLSGGRKYLQQFWRRHRLSPKHQIICDFPQTIIDLVGDGVGMAMVPIHKAEAAIAAGKPIAMLDQFQQTLPLQFIYLDEYEQDPVLQLLRQCVSEVWLNKGC